MSLRNYVRKRDFTKTPEPKGGSAKAGTRSFVIQKHEASHLHYDFRLELGGTLKSWAVPKGIPFSRGEKRLAMQVEDHPIAYGSFEGIIPKGQYGGGTVMVWDYGTFQPQSTTPAKDLAGGKLHFTLHGKKLSGEWYLVRLKDSDKQWLLIRGGDDMKPVSKKQDDTSALSGKSMKRLAHSHVLPLFEPMMAKLVNSPPLGDWHYEIKYDGFRALAFRGADRIRLISRNGKDLGARFPDVVRGLQQLPPNTVVDGEVVVLDPKGKSSFQLLQTFQLGEESSPLFYYAFDMPQQAGEDLRALPLEVRRARLKKLTGRASGVLRYSKDLGSDGAVLLDHARNIGLEGLIGKRKGSAYEDGRRSGAWIKLKTRMEQEFVIGGYTDPAGGRQHFGAILVGVYQRGKLAYCGKVGTGFNESILRMLYAKLHTLALSKCPFRAITPAEIRHSHWVKPKLVCEVQFSEWTRDAKLRQPVFLGLRDDKDARDVRREDAR